MEKVAVINKKLGEIKKVPLSQKSVTNIKKNHLNHKSGSRSWQKRATAIFKSIHLSWQKCHLEKLGMILIIEKSVTEILKIAL